MCARLYNPHTHTVTRGYLSSHQQWMTLRWITSTCRHTLCCIKRHAGPVWRIVFTVWFFLSANLNWSRAARLQGGGSFYLHCRGGTWWPQHCSCAEPLMGLCVCVCVRGRERETEVEREKGEWGNVPMHYSHVPLWAHLQTHHIRWLMTLSINQASSRADSEQNAKAAQTI